MKNNDPNERRGPGWRDLGVQRKTQPDLVSCGPTSLGMVLESLGTSFSTHRLREITEVNLDGGTLGVNLALVAQKLGHQAVMHCYNPRVFDPTWVKLSNFQLVEKLRQSEHVATSVKMKKTLGAYRQFLINEGKICFAELTSELLVRLLDSGLPVLCGLSSTYLYQCSRENPITGEDDDVRGEPAGHFVVLSGYQGHGARFLVVDPYPEVETDPRGRCIVEAHRLINSILLGVLTYDAVLLQIQHKWRF